VGWQPPAAVPPNLQSPPDAFTPPPPGGIYTPLFLGPKVLGKDTKWALGLGAAGILLCCGPFTTIPGIVLAKKDMDEFYAGRAPQINDGWAKAAFYLNIVVLALYVAFLLLYWGKLIPHNS
jgi:hypothetical protein